MPGILNNGTSSLAKGQQPFTTLDNIKSQKNDSEKWKKELEKMQDFAIKMMIQSSQNPMSMFGESGDSSEQMTKSMNNIIEIKNSAITNQTLEKIADSMQNQNTVTEAVVLQGHPISYDESTKDYSGTPVTYNYSLTNNSASKPGTINTSINIYDENDRLIFTGKGSNKLGDHQFAWNGKDSNGKDVDPGKYRISVRATSTTGSVSATTASNGTVKAVVVENGEVKLQLEDGKVIASNQITKVEASEESKEANSQFTAANCIDCLGMEAVVTTKDGKERSVTIEGVNNSTNTITSGEEKFSIANIKEIKAPFSDANNGSIATAGNYISKTVNYEAQIISWNNKNFEQNIRLSAPQADHEYVNIELKISNEAEEEVAKVKVEKDEIAYQGKRWKQVQLNELSVLSQAQVNKFMKENFDTKTLTRNQKKIVNEYIQREVQNGQLIKKTEEKDEVARNATQGMNTITWDGKLSNGGNAAEGERYKIEVVVTTKNTTTNALTTESLPISNISKVKEVITQDGETILVLTNGDKITTDKIIDIA